MGEWHRTGALMHWKLTLIQIRSANHHTYLRIQLLLFRSLLRVCRVQIESLPDLATQDPLLNHGAHELGITAYIQ